MFGVGDTDISITVFVYDDAGLPVTGLVAATFPTVLFSSGTGSDVTITLSDLSSLTDAHSDGGLKERGEGGYRLDLPDSIATTAGVKSIRAEATNKRLTAPPIIVGGKVAQVASLGTQAQADVNAEVDAALADAGVTTTRTGYLDKLNISGSVASAADIAAITQAQRVRINLFSMLERPDSGSTAFRIYIYSYNEQHQAEDLDSVPTVTAENNTATDRSANLGTVTKVSATTGIYYVDYNVASTHAIEGIVLRVTATENSVSTQYSAAAMIVDTTAVDFTSSDRTKLEAVYNKLPSANYLTGTANSNGSGYSTLTTGDVSTQSQAGAAAALSAFGAATATNVSDAADEVIAHGDGAGAWGATGEGGGSGAGQYVRTVTVTSGVDAVSGVLVSLWHGSTRLSYEYTNASGVAVVRSDAATGLSLRAAPSSAYETPANQTINVTADGSSSFSLTRRTASAPAAAGLCSVLFNYELNGEPVEGAIIEVSLAKDCFRDGVLLSHDVVELETDVDGQAEIDLVKFAEITSGTGTYTVRIYHPTTQELSQEHQFEVRTSADSIDFESLMALQP